VSCTINIAEKHYDQLLAHLFPGDDDEHGAVLRAGLCTDGNQVRLLVREVIPAREGTDYVPGRTGYRALHPTFIHKHITSCRNDRLVYLAVHNHHSDEHVGFSRIDLSSHEQGYPALLDIAEGMPVGALVFGKRSVEADIWMPGGKRLALAECRIVGRTIRRIGSAPFRGEDAFNSSFDRQVRMFGLQGQARLATAKVAVLGLGGVGSIVAEYLARLGVGRILLVDPDHIEDTNLSRVVGSTLEDVEHSTRKTEIAARHIREIRRDSPAVEIADDVAKIDVAQRLRACDFLFLAADSMRARLVFNALVHQYLIPGVQLGAKISAGPRDELQDAMSAVRQVRPGLGCLWCNQLIDPTQLAIESKTDSERMAQAYGVNEPNPSVIAMNGVSAAHAVNEFLFDFLGLRKPGGPVEYRHFHYLEDSAMRVVPRQDAGCSECGQGPLSRFGKGDAVPLPCIQ